MHDLQDASEWGLDGSSSRDDAAVKTTIRELKSQILAFEARLEALKAKERSFQDDTRAFIRAMNEYAERHSADDRRLRGMVEADTARSKDANEEYEVLQSRFDETKKGRSRTKMRQMTAKVFVYLSIVIPFVLMAPLHAIFWLIERLLNRLGWKKQKRPDVPYGRSSGRRRDRRSSNNVAVPRMDGSSGVVGEDKTGKKENAAGGGGGGGMDMSASITGKTKVVRKRNVGKSEDLQYHTEETAETEESRYSSFEEAGGDGENEERKGDSDDVFVDACDGNEENEARGYESENESESGKLEVESDSSNDSHKKRPGWARLGESSESVGDLKTLPSSSALWDMSDDDLLITGMERINKSGGE